VAGRNVEGVCVVRVPAAEAFLVVAPYLEAAEVAVVDSYPENRAGM